MYHIQVVSEMNKHFIKPGIIKWAVERSGYNRAELKKKFKELPVWECKGAKLTQNQLIKLSKVVHVPYFTFFSEKPPKETLPISDFRTIKGKRVTRLSPNLYDVVGATLIRQDWYREYALSENLPKVEFVGTTNINSCHLESAHKLQELLNFRISDRSQLAENEDILKFLSERMEALGILVMISGIVDSNTRRKLDLEEFRGFALCDEYAPLIFVNARDTKPAQLFTLAHELGHLVLGSTGLTNIGIRTPDELKQNEIWCNKFVAEFLVPQSSLKEQIQDIESIEKSVIRLANYYRVNRLVVLRRLFDLGVINSKIFGQRMRLYSGQRKKLL